MSEKTLIYKITLVGEPQVGMSNLLNRYIYGNFDPPPTRLAIKMYDKRVKIPGTNDEARFFFWEIVYRAFLGINGWYNKIHFKGTSGVMLIFDTTRRKTFDDLAYLHDEIKKQVKKVVPGILVGTKIDLVDQRVVSTKEGQEYADKIKYAYIETSAKTKHNVTETFNSMIWEVLFPGKAKIDELVNKIKRIEKLLNQNGLKLADYQYLKEKLNKLYEVLENT